MWPASTYVLALLRRIGSGGGCGGPLGPGTAVSDVVEGLEHHGLLLLGIALPPAQWGRQASAEPSEQPFPITPSGEQPITPSPQAQSGGEVSAGASEHHQLISRGASGAVLTEVWAEGKGGRRSNSFIKLIYYKDGGEYTCRFHVWGTDAHTHTAWSSPCCRRMLLLNEAKSEAAAAAAAAGGGHWGPREVVPCLPAAPAPEKLPPGCCCPS